MQRIIRKIIDTALSYKGTPYLWGGTTTEGMDCSGLMIKAFKAGGINIPRVADEQAKIGATMELNELTPGDLLFFTDQPGNDKITHVGLITKVSEDLSSVTFVHASSSRGVMESEFFSDYWQSVYLQATRPSAFLSAV